MTVVEKPDYLRQRGFFDPDAHAGAACTLVGVGGIGSFAAFALAKLGIPNLTLIDPDVVEPHNLPSQMFEGGDAYEHKVEAMWGHIAAVSDECSVTSYVARIESDGWQSDGAEHGTPGRLQGLVVSGLDSMKARHDLWHQALRFNPLVPLYIDARLDGQMIVIYTVNPANYEDCESYERTLKSDDEVGAGLCTERAIIDVGFTVAAQITRLVRMHYCGEAVPNITIVNVKTNTIMKGGWIE